MCGTLEHSMEMGSKQSDFKYIMHLLVIAQNQVSIGFLCMLCLEKITLRQYDPHLSMFYHLHLAFFWHISGKTFIVVPHFSH